MENVIIPNPEEFEKKKIAFKNEDKEKVHIISDFDRTLTMAFNKGKKVPSLISYLRNGEYLTKDYAKKAHEIYSKYHPIEVSSSFPPEEKKAKMLEWWKSHYELLVNSGLDEKTIKQAVKDMIKTDSISLRPEADKFLNNLNKNKIPLIILSSSGIGNMVVEFLKKQKLMHENIHFIGNTLKFNKNGKFIGIEDNKIIHIFNKHEVELKNLSVYEEIKTRKNIILLGDSLGDLGMAEGAEYENIIKIAFFNYPDEENLEDFKKNFDVIITNDGSFEFINQLVKEIL